MDLCRPGSPSGWSRRPIIAVTILASCMCAGYSDPLTRFLLYRRPTDQILPTLPNPSSAVADETESRLQLSQAEDHGATREANVVVTSQQTQRSACMAQLDEDRGLNLVPVSQLSTLTASEHHASMYAAVRYNLRRADACRDHKLCLQWPILWASGGLALNPSIERGVAVLAVAYALRSRCYFRSEHDALHHIRCLHFYRW